MKNDVAREKVTMNVIRWRGRIQKLHGRIEDVVTATLIEVGVGDVGKWREGAVDPCNDGRRQRVAENGKPKLIGIREGRIQDGT
jgi:hypothetical protein